MTTRIFYLATASAAAITLASGAFADGWTPSRTLYGMPGLIEMPNARAFDDGQLSFTLGQVAGHTRGTAAFQITDRLTGAFRYTRMPDLEDGSGMYLDRSIDLQYQLTDENGMVPAIAVGVRDLLGNGLYGAEYIVASKTFGSRLQASAGIGWGQLAGRNSFSSPFGGGPRADIALEGAPRQFFNGDAAFFGGLEYTIAPSWRVMAEYSSDRHMAVQPDDSLAPLFEQKTPFNFGVSYSPRESMQFGAYVLGGTTYGLSATFVVNPQTPYAMQGADSVPVPVGQPDMSAAGTWQAGPGYDAQVVAPLSFAMKEQGLMLRGVQTTGSTMRVRYVNSRYRAEAQAMGRLARILSQVAPAGVTQFVLEPEVNGVAKSQLVISRADLVALENELGAAEQLRSRVVIRDGQSSEGLSPAPREGSRLAWGIAPFFDFSFSGPNDELRYQLGLKASVDYAFSDSLKFSAEVRQRLYGNGEHYDVASLPVGATPLPVVRRDGGNYMLSSSPELHHLTLTHYGKLAPNVFTRVTGGYLERMYGGISGEVLWKPAGSQFGLGAELSYAVKRDETGLGFQDYSAVTGIVSAYYEFDGDMVARLDLGRYLAGDWGGTLAVEREFPNGWVIGGYVTVTDSPFESDGEASFEKGVHVTIPVDWLIGTPTKDTRGFSLSSPSWDGGQRVETGTPLYDYVRDAHAKDLDDSWGRFWK